MAAIDVDNHTGFHLDACQTLTGNHPDKSLAGIYADCFTGHSEKLSEMSRIAVADARFTTTSFLDAVCDAGFHFVGTMRDDANLQYPYIDPQKPGRGRPRTYNAKAKNQTTK